MKKILASFFVALFCVCSRADTNTVDFSQIENLLSSIDATLSEIEARGFQNDVLSEPAMPKNINQIRLYLNTMRSHVQSIYNILNGYSTSPLFSRWETIWSGISTSLTTANGYLQSIEADTNNAEYYIEQCYYEILSASSTLSSCLRYLSDIAYYAQSLPRIEDYQSALSVIVSNINDHILAGINVSIPNTINVDVRNFPNFNPEWDYLSRSFNWSGALHGDTWQQFVAPDSQDNSLWAASPMPVAQQSTLGEYLEMLYSGINNAGSIINDSIIHACYLLEGSNSVSQAEQEAVADSASSSVENAPTAMEQISSSIPTPVLGVNTSYIQRGMSFWDQIANLQKPTSIVLSTSPEEGDFFSVPEVYLEVKLSDHPGLDKVLEFARSIFTWFWWLLSVLFLLWLFRRSLALYSMVMSLLGPQPVKTTAVDVI